MIFLGLGLAILLGTIILFLIKKRGDKKFLAQSTEKVLNEGFSSAHHKWQECNKAGLYYCNVRKQKRREILTFIFTNLRSVRKFLGAFAIEKLWNAKNAEFLRTTFAVGSPRSLSVSILSRVRIQHLALIR